MIEVSARRRRRRGRVLAGVRLVPARGGSQSLVSGRWPGWRRRWAAGAVLGAAAVVAVLWGSAALAQVTGAKLVGNLGESTNTPQGSINAQSFSTGSAEFGYELTDVRLRLSSSASLDTSSTVYVRVHADDGGEPGDELAAFENPATFVDDARNVFEAPSGVVLAPDSTYWVVVNGGIDSAADQITVDTASSNALDTDSAAGWDIADDRLTKATSADIWLTSSLELKFAINGAAVPDTTLNRLDVVVAGGNVAAKEPQFDPDTTSYRAWVADSVERVTIRSLPALYEDGVTTVSVSDGTTTKTAALAGFVLEASFGVDEGVNEFTVKISRSDTSTVSTYTVSVLRAPAAGTDTTLVANSDLTAAGDVFDGVRAMWFETGPNSTGYSLAGVDLLLGTGNTALDTTKKSYVELWSSHSDGTRPGGRLAQFDNPMTFADNTVTEFAPPTGTVLDANTRYWIVINFNAELANLEVAHGETPDGPLAESARGWDIAKKSRDGVNTGTLQSKVPLVRVRGAAESAAAAAELAGLSAVDGDGAAVELVPFPFVPDVLRYTARVAASVDEVTLSAVAGTDGSVFFPIDDDPATTAEATFALGAEHTRWTYPVSAVAPDGLTTKTYQVEITRMGSPTTLVTNTAQSNDGVIWAGTSFGEEAIEQGFVTGPDSGGYVLGGVSLVVSTVSLGPGESFTVAVHSEAPGGQAGSLVAQLISPDSYTVGALNRFEAPPGVRLDPDTRYYLVFTGTAVSSDDFQFRTTDSNAQSGEPGWTIDNRYWGYGDFVDESVKMKVDDWVASTDASLSGLDVASDGAALAVVPEFDAETASYSTAVGPDVDEVRLTATPADGAARAVIEVGSESGVGALTFEVADGVNEATVTVTAEDGATTQVYRLAVWRAASSDEDDLVTNSNRDEDHVVDVGNIDLDNFRQQFKTGTNPDGYLVTSVGAVVDSEDFDEGEAIRAFLHEVDPGNRRGDLVGELFAPASFTAGAENFFTTPGLLLDAETDYQLVFDGSGDAASDFAVSLTASNAQTSGDGWTIEDGYRFGNQIAVNSLRMTVRGAVLPSSDSSLSSLAVTDADDDDLGLVFDAAQTAYDLTVPNQADTVKIAAAAAGSVAISPDDDTSTPDEAEISLDVGDNEVTVTVTADNGATTVYALTLTREAPFTAEFLNVPAIHGVTPFNVGVRFSAPPALQGYPTAADLVLANMFAVATSITGMTVQTGTDDLLFTVTVSPLAADKDVVLRLTTPTSCDAGIPLCTEAGTPLSAGDTKTVRGLPTVSIADANADLSVAEDVGTLSFEVELSQTWVGDVTVNWATSVETGDTATLDPNDPAGADFDTDSGTVTITTGDTSATFTVAVTDDSVDEDDETFTVTLTNPVGAALGDDVAVGHIFDDDDPPTVTRVFLRDGSSDSDSEEEGAGAWVSLSAPSARDISINVSAVSVTATVGEDYVAPASPATIDAGTTEKLLFNTIDDALDEATENITVELSSPTNVTLPSLRSWFLFLRDNDPAPSLSVTPATAAEGSPLEFVVSLSEVSEREVTVTYRTSDGTATAGSDYTGIFVSAVTIPAGDLSGVASVTTLVDGVDEGASGETMTLTLRSAQNATLPSVADRSAVGTILDEALPAVVAAPPAVTVTEEGTPVSIDVTLATEPTETVTVTVTAPAGLTASPLSLTFATTNWDTAQAVALSAADDANSANEELSVPFAAASDDTDYDGLGTSVAVSVRDNDVPTVASVEFTSPPADGEYNVGDIMEVTVTMSAPVTVTGTPQIRVLSEGVSPYVDYAAAASTATELVFQETVTGTGRDDDTNGFGVAQNGLRLDGGSIRAAGSNLDALLDHAHVITQTPIRTRWVENFTMVSTPSVPGYDRYGPGEVVEFGVAFEQAVTVTGPATGIELHFRVGTERAVAAYSGGSGTDELRFAWTVPASVQQPLRPPWIRSNYQQNTFYQAASGLEVSGSTALVSNSGLGVNYRHDAVSAGPAPLDWVVDTWGPVPDGRPGGATVDGAALVAGFVNEIPGEIKDDPLDAAALPSPSAFTVTVGGATRQVRSVSASDNELTLMLASPVAYGQTVTLAYNRPSGSPLADAWGNPAASFSAIAVRNDTPQPMLSILDTTGSEGDAAVEFTVSLGAVAGVEVTAQWATTAGTATAGGDFDAASGTVVLAPGVVEQTVRIVLVDDTAPEHTETFTVTLTNPTGVPLSRATATATIADDDPPATPGGFDVTAGDTELFVRWNPTSFADTYKVQWRAGAGAYNTATVTATRHTIGGLTNDTAYTVQVVAVRSGVADSAPTASITATPIDNPDTISADIDTTASITVGESWLDRTAPVGRVDHYGDNDWYRTQLQAGDCYQIEIRSRTDSERYFDPANAHLQWVKDHAPTEPLTLDQPFLAGIHDHTGRYLTGSQKGMGPISGHGPSILALIRPTTTGTHYIAVTHAHYTTPGTYDLSLIKLPSRNPYCVTIT